MRAKQRQVGILVFWGLFFIIHNSSLKASFGWEEAAFWDERKIKEVPGVFRVNDFVERLYLEYVNESTAPSNKIDLSIDKKEKYTCQSFVVEWTGYTLVEKQLQFHSTESGNGRSARLVLEDPKASTTKDFLIAPTPMGWRSVAEMFRPGLLENFTPVAIGDPTEWLEEKYYRPHHVRLRSSFYDTICLRAVPPSSGGRPSELFLELGIKNDFHVTYGKRFIRNPNLSFYVSKLKVDEVTSELVPKATFRMTLGNAKARLSSYLGPPSFCFSDKDGPYDSETIGSEKYSNYRMVGLGLCKLTDSD